MVQIVLLFIFLSQCLLVLLYSCLSYIIDIIMGRQLYKLMPFWQPANILHSVLIFMLLWQINIVVVVVYTTPLSTLILSLHLNHHLYADDTQLFLSFHPSNFHSDSDISPIQQTSS